ncbi:hypothetical protein [Paraburkholderia sp. C35]|uniref:hypothetical protein n=1 Tax=Paraburkholderia sp. C35 TaxID=2126993 RepID=UPI0013A5A278|nr:hypothetical protein [Paraburkholderia sp. C35]
MSKINLSCDWLPTGNDSPEIRDTSGRLTIAVDGHCLTRSEDIWTRTVRDDVLVSAYPLALWFASSWWRLLHEPLADTKGTPAIDWRMSHELGAANHGFVWPNVSFTSDGEEIQIGARASNPESQQSVRYLESLNAPARIRTAEFEREIERFIGSVVSRLETMGHSETELASLWSLVQKDRSNADSARLRRLEALLGYDQEECPDELLETARRLEKRVGQETFAELAPAYGATQGTVTLDDLIELEQLPGLIGKPHFDTRIVVAGAHSNVPWECAAATAHELRKSLRYNDDLIPTSSLYAALGLNPDSVAGWKPPLSIQKVGVAAPVENGMFVFKPRKNQPIAQRFEFARFIGDLLATSMAEPQWLASTDSVTWRQKFQRAFAAEFLCPIASLLEFLNGDDSMPSLMHAARHFQVGFKTVYYLLLNKRDASLSSHTADLQYHRFA